MTTSLALANWVPLQPQIAATELLCEWLYLGENCFTESFFDDTIRACRRDYRFQRRSKVVSDLEMMLEWSYNIPFIPVTAIIFHVSRCGSTLLSQLLAADEKNSVLSEVPFLDAMLRLPYQQKEVPTAKAEDYFKASLAFYGRQRRPEQERLFIKADSWHLHFYPQLRRLFPTVPFFLLFREPVGVIHSQQRQRGIHSVPGMIEPELLHLTAEQSREYNLDVYMSQVLTGFYRQMIAILEADPLAVPLHYAGGMENNIRKVYQHLRLPVDSHLSSVFSDRCRFDAKRPKQVFAEEKGAPEVPPFLATAFQLYQQLACINATAPSIS